MRDLFCSVLLIQAEEMPEWQPATSARSGSQTSLKTSPILPVQSGLVALQSTPGTKQNQSKETWGLSNLLPHMNMLA